ncbi:hypothetical protein [Niveispirillum irakense]|uniref:hypothetical protein n=1 Tax=Niveispirillum irakense TaxID=34011 RepID=UPI0004900AA3|nr:hypothetical protein [Niveispirillum irakense]
MVKSTKGRVFMILMVLMAFWSGWRLWERNSPHAPTRLAAEIAWFNATGQIYPIRSLQPDEFSYLCVLGPYRSAEWTRGPYADLLLPSLSAVKPVEDEGHIKLLLLRPDRRQMKDGKPVFTVEDIEINRSLQFDLWETRRHDWPATPPAGFRPMDCAAVEKASFLRMNPGAYGRQYFIFGERTVGE